MENLETQKKLKNYTKPVKIKKKVYRWNKKVVTGYKVINFLYKKQINR